MYTSTQEFFDQVLIPKLQHAAATLSNRQMVAAGISPNQICELKRSGPVRLSFERALNALAELGQVEFKIVVNHETALHLRAPQ